VDHQIRVAVFAYKKENAEGVFNVIGALGEMFPQAYIKFVNYSIVKHIKKYMPTLCVCYEDHPLQKEVEIYAKNNGALIDYMHEQWGNVYLLQSEYLGDWNVVDAPDIKQIIEFERISVQNKDGLLNKEVHEWA
jgi:hypothetical protein